MPKILVCPKPYAQYEKEMVSVSVLPCDKQETMKLKLKLDVEVLIISCDINASFGNRALIVSL